MSARRKINSRADRSRLSPHRHATQAQDRSAARDRSCRSIAPIVTSRAGRDSEFFAPVVHTYLTVARYIPMYDDLNATYNTYVSTEAAFRRARLVLASEVHTYDDFLNATYVRLNGR